MPKRSLLILMILTMVAPSAFALTPAHLWSKGFGAALWDFPNAVAVDGSGNVYLTGLFTGTVNFGGGDLTSAGGYDIFLAKFSAAGVHQWSRRFGDIYSDLGTSVAVDASGNVYATGWFAGTANFGGANLVSSGADDTFLAKFNAAGVHQWSRAFGGTSLDRGTWISADASGRTVLTGYFYGTAAFGDTSFASAGIADIFLASYDANGVHQWSERFGGVGNDMPSEVALDGAGRAFVTGSFTSVTDLGGGNLTGAGGGDVFLACYSATGAHQWSKRFGSVGPDQGNSLAVDGAGNVIVAGYFGDTVDFGGGGLVCSGGQDAFLAKYNGAGTHQWSRSLGGSSYDQAFGVTVDPSGNLFLTGLFHRETNFGGSNLVAADSTEDVILAKFSPTGAHCWSQRFGGAGNDGGMAIAADGSRGVVVTGFFDAPMNMGGGELQHAGIDDIFLAKFASEPAQPVISSIRDVANDQGRRVRIQFTRSGHDDVADASPVAQYEAYRMNTQAAMVAPAATVPRAQLLDQGWVYAGSVPAHGVSGYVMDASTDGDSTVALGPYHSVFFIRAALAAPTTYYDSAPDTGYSVDNLSPGVPQNVVYTEGELKWKKSTDADFDYFTVYGGNTREFGGATLIDHGVTPGMDVSGSPYEYYFVTATDFSGNEGKPAVVSRLSGAVGTPSSYVLSISSYPNPFNPETTVRYTVPSKGRVTIAIYDARGARVATLLDETRNAGAYTQPWNGSDDAGRAVSSGVYFARITHPAGMKSYKLTLLK